MAYCRIMALLSKDEPVPISLFQHMPHNDTFMTLVHQEHDVSVTLTKYLFELKSKLLGLSLSVFTALC